MSYTPIPSIKVVKKWKQANVVDFLKEKKEELELENEDIQIIDKNRVNGRAFLELSQEDGKCQHEKKRKTKEELTITKPNKRRWEVNGAIEPSIVHSVYFVNPTEESRPLLEKIHEGQFVALHGARASGKSTRVHQIQKQLNNEGYICIYVSLEQINIKSVDNFWETFGTQIHLDASKYIKFNSIKSANDFNIVFQKSKCENRVVIFIDEFDMLYNATEDVLSSCLNTIRGIKGTKKNCAIWSVVAIGPFSILYLNSNNLTTSPFNVNESFQNPNFTLEQVQFLYKQFADEFKLTIDHEVIDDMYAQTNGKLFPVLENGTQLSFEIWECFTAFLLGNEILEYSTFIRMKESLLKDDTNTRRAVNLIRSDFLVNNDPIYVAENKKDLALFLTAEGVLIPGEDAGTFKISSPLLARVLVNNANNQEVRESVYDAELYQIMSNWLGRFRVTGQWHLKYCASGHINNKYVDIVISRSDHPKIVFEFLATATKKELKEHYERALIYDKKLPADETWIVHFTYEENAISEPC
ncbi:16617_t:CDS:2 [Entrophospora sp. SA101]|nr:16617_t:CDS:2 [Entrophospora sp. SA101]